MFEFLMVNVWGVVPFRFCTLIVDPLFTVTLLGSNTKLFWVTFTAAAPVPPVAPVAPVEPVDPVTPVAGPLGAAGEAVVELDPPHAAARNVSISASAAPVTARLHPTVMAAPFVGPARSCARADADVPGGCVRG